MVESRNGVLFEVGPGSNLPGLGRVETIKRENGQLVVVAKNGIIIALSEARRPPVRSLPLLIGDFSILDCVKGGAARWPPFALS